MLSATPDGIAVWTEEGRNDTAAEIGLRPVTDGAFQVLISAAPTAALTYVVLRWAGPMPAVSRILGDHWERGYGDLEWRGVVPERALPWYALVYDVRTEETRGFGVGTGTASFASWRVDGTGVTLVLDVRCGGRGVRLGGRCLEAAVVRELSSRPGETPFAFAGRFCSILCPKPRLPACPVYGGNDWYFRYGANTAESVRRDSALIRELSPSVENAPTFVIDAGWSPGVCDGGPYERGTEHFPDMAGLAEELRGSGVRPGIWIRPLLMTERVPDYWQMAPEHPHANAPGACLDPSVPEVLEGSARMSGVYGRGGMV